MSIIDGMKRQLTSAMTGVAPSSQLDDLSGRVHRQGEAIEALLAENADLRRESGSLGELLEVQHEHFERLERWMNNSISGKARSPRVHGDSKHRKHDGVCNVKHYLHFPGSSPTDVASFGNNFPIALRAFSICFWLRTRAPYLGTILSYATSDNDNKLVLYGRNSSKTGLQLVIGDPEHRELPVDTLLGGSWHHVCIMWSAHGGRYAFYIDRRLVAAGSGLRQGYTIPSDGFLVLGQEQDLPGGGFESHESFVGNIAGFALWTRFLAPGEVSALATGRRMPMEGLILTLSDLAMVHGQVSTF
uniref:Pentraxin 4 n=1 Tax=Eptatretus burgeri TaxID=7764 RepID=A0A8C4R5Z2_EPTBU